MIRRRMLILASAFSLLLCLVATAIPMFGGWSTGGRFRSLTRFWLTGTQARDGVVHVALLHLTNPKPLTKTAIPLGQSPQLLALMQQHPPYFRWRRGETELSCAPEISFNVGIPPSLYGSRTVISIPDWELASAFLLLPVFTFWRWRRWKKLVSPLDCIECGYNLTGNGSGVCPECGTPVQSKPEAIA